MSYSLRKRRRRRQQAAFRTKVLAALLTIFAASGAAALTLVGWVVNTAASAPELRSIKERQVGANAEVVAADGTRLGFLQADDISQPVPASELPEVLKDATVAIEDERFFAHDGVDYEGIVRAAVQNFVSRKTLQGGSTITMQLVRNLYTGEKAREGLAGYQRKIREAKLAEELENEHSKQWILAKYLNTVPYGTTGGQTAIGAAAAARIYFDKPVRRLTLREAALLAGLPQAPSLYSPFNNPESARSRRDEVLSKMAELRMITPGQATAARARGLGVKLGRYFRRKREAYVFDYVKDELMKEYGPKVALSGLKVHTTIDLDKQEAARKAVAERMGDIGPSSAIVTVDPRNGRIVTMASTGRYGKSQFNLAAQGRRQPGSAFKTMVLMTALRRGVDPDRTFYTSVSPTRIDDGVCGPPFEIKTYSSAGGGRMSLRTATLKSDNSVYIQLAVDLGPAAIAETARNLGIRTKLNGYCAESLGGLEIGVSPLEMASAYATIASGGYRSRPTIIKRVEFPDGSAELPRRWRVHRVRVLSDGVTAKAVEILRQNIEQGTGTRAAIGCPAGGKTGTTDSNTDAWFVGFTPRLATAVWVGYPNDRTEMTGLYHGANVDGGTFPAEIWGTYMKVAIGRFCGDFPPPKEPFLAKPFTGKYAGRDAAGADEGSTDPYAVPSSPAPSTGDGEAGHGGREPFDPGQYESPSSPPTPDSGAGSGGTTAP
jgi:penicillin-binding protein 1A